MHAVSLLDAALLFPTLLRDLDGARQRVLIRTPPLSPGRMARALGARLAEAAAHGAEVRLLSESTRPHWLSGRTGTLCVIDGVMFAGAFRFTDGWLPPRPHAAAREVDVDIGRVSGTGPQGRITSSHGLALRAVGALADDAAAVFDGCWRRGQGAPAARLDTGTRHDDVRLCFAPTADDPVPATIALESVLRARRRVWLEAPLFDPSPAMGEALVAASRRRVDVRVVVPERFRGPLLGRAARARFQRWLSAGIGLHEYLPAGLDGQALVVDEALALVGAVGMRTPLSPCDTLCLQFRDPGVTTAIAAHIQRDLAQCRPITRDDLGALGPAERAFDRAAAGLVRFADAAFA